MLTEDHLVSLEPNLASLDPALRQSAFIDLVENHRQREIDRISGRQAMLCRMEGDLLAQAVDDAFLKLWLESESARPGWPEQWTWFYFRGIVNNKAIDAARRAHRAKLRFGEHQRVAPKCQEDELEIYGEVGPEIEARERRSESLMVAQRVLNALPKQQRRVAQLLLENPDSRLGPGKLAELYHEKYRIGITTVAAKGALAVVREKLRDARRRSVE